MWPLCWRSDARDSHQPLRQRLRRRARLDDGFHLAERRLEVAQHRADRGEDVGQVAGKGEPIQAGQDPTRVPRGEAATRAGAASRAAD
jgi:hypothetical protein